MIVDELDDLVWVGGFVEFFVGGIPNVIEYVFVFGISECRVDGLQEDCFVELGHELAIAEGFVVSTIREERANVDEELLDFVFCRDRTRE